MAKRRILVAGASALVGHAAVRHFAGLPDAESVAVSRRTPLSLPGAHFIPVDLFDQRRCIGVFSQMDNITHLIYAAVSEKPGLRICCVNGSATFRN